MEHIRTRTASYRPPGYTPRIGVNAGPPMDWTDLLTALAESPACPPTGASLTKRLIEWPEKCHELADALEGWRSGWGPYEYDCDRLVFTERFPAFASETIEMHAEFRLKDLPAEVLFLIGQQLDLASYACLKLSCRGMHAILHKTIPQQARATSEGDFEPSIVDYGFDLMVQSGVDATAFADCAMVHELLETSCAERDGASRPDKPADLLFCRGCGKYMPSHCFAARDRAVSADARRPSARWCIPCRIMDAHEDIADGSLTKGGHFVCYHCLRLLPQATKIHLRVWGIDGGAVLLWCTAPLLAAFCQRCVARVRKEMRIAHKRDQEGRDRALYSVEPDGQINV